MELLAPAGDMEKLKAAILFGADACYLSGKEFGLRAFTDNFDLDEMKQAIKYAHEHNVKIYVTVNIYARNKDFEPLKAYLNELIPLGPDGLLISDPGVFTVAKSVIDSLPGYRLNNEKTELHISTQANTTNYMAASFWKNMGASRVVLARELSFGEISEINEKVPDIELEAFVHGAMCMSYSGRCLLSNYMTGRESNRGECAQACRWNYTLMEEKRPGEYFPLEEDTRGSYIFNSKDMCLLEQLPMLYKCGVKSLKIEGRMKSPHYVATITKVYREAIDAYEKDPDNWKVQPHWLTEIVRISHRQYTTGFFLGSEFTDANINLDSNENEKIHTFLGVVLDYDKNSKTVTIEQRNKFLNGEILEFVPPKGSNFNAKCADLKDIKGNNLLDAPHPKEHLQFTLETEVLPGTLIRRG